MRRTLEFVAAVGASLVATAACGSSSGGVVPGGMRASAAEWIDHYSAAELGDREGSTRIYDAGEFTFEANAFTERVTLVKGLNESKKDAILGASGLTGRCDLPDGDASVYSAFSPLYSVIVVYTPLDDGYTILEWEEEFESPAGVNQAFCIGFLSGTWTDL